MENKYNLISLAEYAKLHNRHIDSVRQKCQRGGFETAVKIGRNWLIDKDETYSDNRENGKSKRWSNGDDI